MAHRERGAGSHDRHLRAQAAAGAAVVDADRERPALSNGSAPRQPLPAAADHTGHVAQAASGVWTLEVSAVSSTAGASAITPRRSRAPAATAPSRHSNAPARKA